ncbi:hypothetical protein D3Z60_02265 [Lachnospiraceae bacterium]|nr:hypothetical protein [Lachnospiraceae bacterium]
MLNIINKYYIIYTKAKAGILIGNKRLLCSFFCGYFLPGLPEWHEAGKVLYIKRKIRRGFFAKGW